MSKLVNLPSYLGKNIKDICGNFYIDNGKSHCAHLVSHAMGYTFGMKCRQMTGKGEGIGGNIRVHEIFKKCQKVGKWEDKPNSGCYCLAFITKAINVNIATKFMRNIGRKHVGIFYNGHIYHYSNRKYKKVVRQLPSDFKNHYGPGYQVFYGEFPIT